MAGYQRQGIRAHIATADMHAPAAFGVAWAGEKIFAQLVHIAREYTEKCTTSSRYAMLWASPAFLTREFYHPVLDYIYDGASVYVSQTPTPRRRSSTGNAHRRSRRQLVCHLQRQWELSKALPARLRAYHIDGDMAWKLFTKLAQKRHRPYVTVEGDKRLAEIALDMIAVMA